jgi:hypothetical protein
VKNDIVVQFLNFSFQNQVSIITHVAEELVNSIQYQFFHHVNTKYVLSKLVCLLELSDTVAVVLFQLHSSKGQYQTSPYARLHHAFIDLRAAHDPLMLSFELNCTLNSLVVDTTSTLLPAACAGTRLPLLSSIHNWSHFVIIYLHV